MKIKALLRNMQVKVHGSKEISITGLSSDSKTVCPGNLFFARKGTLHDGSQFIPQALRGGAVALVTDLYDPSCKATQVIVDRPEILEAEIAARYFGAPSKELFVAAVTGSKGKTTTSYLIWHLLHVLEGRGGLASTVETKIGSESRESAFTTHFPIQNQKLLREMVTKGCGFASMEVSSHGLAQGRIDSIDFDVGVWTNFFPDHLDYHKTIENSRTAKARLFDLLLQSKKKKKLALVNQGGPFIFQPQNSCISIWTFGLDASADIAASAIEETEDALLFDVCFRGEKTRCKLPQIGAYNVLNALGAIGVALFRGHDLTAIAEAMMQFEGVPGRMQRIDNDRGILVFVDYAHTGDALQKALQAVRKSAKKKVICVFGCGGERDPNRREAMGKASELGADFSIITSDNPRGEDPLAIIQQIASVFQEPKRFAIIADRKEAIWRAIGLAEEGDVVLIAGKGHEKVQKIGSQSIAFCDASEAMRALKEGQ